MIRHIVCWKLKDQAEGRGKSENALLIKEKLLHLQAGIPEILTMEVGIDIALERSNWDIVLNATFADAFALEHYQNHPEHVAFKAFIPKFREEKVAVDYEF